MVSTLQKVDFPPVHPICNSMFLRDPAAPYSETLQELRFADTLKRISADVLDKGQDSKGDFSDKNGTARRPSLP